MADHEPFEMYAECDVCFRAVQATLIFALERAVGDAEVHPLVQNLFRWYP